MTEHIKLDGKQEQFVKERFVFGELLFDRVEEFVESDVETVVTITTAKDAPIAAYQSANPFTISYPKHVEVIFYKSSK